MSMNTRRCYPLKFKINLSLKLFLIFESLCFRWTELGLRWTAYPPVQNTRFVYELKLPRGSDHFQRRIPLQQTQEVLNHQLPKSLSIKQAAFQYCFPWEPRSSLYLFWFRWRITTRKRVKCCSTVRKDKDVKQKERQTRRFRCITKNYKTNGW